MLFSTFLSDHGNWKIEKWSIIWKYVFIYIAMYLQTCMEAPAKWRNMS